MRWRRSDHESREADFLGELTGRSLLERPTREQLAARRRPERLFPPVLVPEEQQKAVRVDDEAGGGMLPEYQLGEFDSMRSGALLHVAVRLLSFLSSREFG